MKVYFLLVAVLITSVTSLNAQKISFGPEIGSNVIQLQKTDLGRDYNLCWLAGGNFEYEFYDFFSLRSGIYFSQRKKMYESEDTSVLNIFGFELNDLGIPGADFSVYSSTRGVTSQFGLEIPILATFNFNGVSFFAGPYFHFMVGAWSKEVTKTHIPFLQTFNIDSIDQSGFLSYLFPPAVSEKFSESSSKTNLKIFDYGFKTGLSYEANGFRTNFYYTFGIPDYRIDRGPDVTRSHQYMGVSIAYNFKVGRKNSSSFQ